MRALSSVLLAALLAGCAATSDIESRDFMVQQNATPASIDASTAQEMARLLSESGPTYVTLVVSAKGSPGAAASSKPSDNRGKPATSGSGFLVDGSGYVMTAAHVALGKGNDVSARAANGRIYGGQVIAILPTNDMALIKLKGYSGRAATPVKDQCIRPGSMVYSLGKPHAQGDTARIGKLESMSYGRAVQYGKFGYPDAMVLKMGTQKGESGGPVFDEQGHLVGMVVSTLTDAQGNLINLAHAIPANDLAHFLCSNMTCNPAWKAAAEQSAANCSNI
jgi:S1-C subfamily serine protease